MLLSTIHDTRTGTYRYSRVSSNMVDVGRDHDRTGSLLLEYTYTRVHVYSLHVYTCTYSSTVGWSFRCCCLVGALPSLVVVFGFYRVVLCTLCTLAQTTWCFSGGGQTRQGSPHQIIAPDCIYITNTEKDFYYHSVSRCSHHVLPSLL